MEEVQLGAAVVAVTEIVKRVVPDSWGKLEGALVILVAAVLGGLAGLAGINGLDIISGVFVGLGAAGVITVASRLSK